MQLRSLQIYRDTIALRSFSRAAEANGVSQSSASQVVHQLEERLGVELIDRSTRPFRVTEVGQKYYEGCRALLRGFDELERDVRSLHTEVESRLAVGSIYSVGLEEMRGYVDEFSRSHPRVDVQLDYWRSERVREAVEQEEVDLGIVSYPERTRRLAFASWRDERLVIVCPPGHRLAGVESAPLEAVRGEAFVPFDRSLPIRGKIDRLLARGRIEVEVTQEFDNTEMMKRAIETGSGLGLMPAPTVAHEVARGSLFATPLTDPTIVRPLGVVFRRDRNLSETARAFIALLQSHACDAWGTARPTGLPGRSGAAAGGMAPA